MRLGTSDRVDHELRFMIDAILVDLETMVGWNRIGSDGVGWACG
jgi:hypothetical protein